MAKTKTTVRVQKISGGGGTREKGLKYKPTTGRTTGQTGARGRKVPGHLSTTKVR